MNSRIWKIGVLALSLLLVGSSAVRAQPAPPALPVAQFVDETTVLVADLNVGSVDLDACRTWALALLKQGGLPEQKLADFEKESAGGIDVFKKWQAGFVKAGGSHLYVVLSVYQEAPVFLVFPLGAGGNMDALKKSLSQDGGLPPDMVRGAASEAVGNMLVMGPPPAIKHAKEIAENPQRTPRPDIAAAFAAAGDAPHRLAFAPSEQLKGGLIIQQPKLPPELGGGATAPVVNSFKYASMGLHTPTAASAKASYKIVVQARDANGAQTLKNLADTAIKQLRAQADHIAIPIPPAMFDQMTPQLAGDQLVIEMDQAKFESSAKTLVAAIGRGQDQAKKVMGMANMRQVLMGVLIFENEKGTLPNRLPEDISKYVAGGDAEQAKKLFTNPTTGRYPGYIYIKPAEKMAQVQTPATKVVLYEAYDQWPAGGIGVGFADGHVEMVANEAEFKKMLNNK